MVYRGFGMEQITPPEDKPFRELTPEEQGEKGAEMMMNLMTSCPGKSVMSGVTGFFLGGVFGIFMASMAYDTPFSVPNSDGSLSQMQKMADLPLRQQVKLQFADMGKRAYTSAKNFGYIGLIYAGVECVVESTRAKNDLYNGITAGCITGGALAYKNGPQAAALGCAGFALFSAAIDTYLRSEDGRPPENDFRQ